MSSQYVTRTVAGLSRSFWLHLPDTSAPSGGWPVVIGFHGRTTDPENFRALWSDKVNPPANFAMVFPRAQQANDNLYRWRIPEQTVDPGLGIDYNNDPLFLADIVAYLAGTDASGPIYLAGWSGGSKMVHRAMMQGDAAFSGFWFGGRGALKVLSDNSVALTKKTRIYFGQDDPTWAYDGDADTLSGIATVARIADLMGDTSLAIKMEGHSPGNEVKYYLYQNTRVGNEIRLGCWVVAGKGHAFTSDTAWQTTTACLNAFGLG